VVIYRTEDKKVVNEEYPNLFKSSSDFPGSVWKGKKSENSIIFKVKGSEEERFLNMTEEDVKKIYERYGVDINNPKSWEGWE